MCTEYASAIAGLTREATAAAAPSPPPRALLVHRDARQPLPPSSQAAQPATLKEAAVAAPFGDKDTATGSVVAATDNAIAPTGSVIAEADGSERERTASSVDANRVTQRKVEPAGEDPQLEMHAGFPLREGLSIGDNATGLGGEGIPSGMVFDAVLTSPPYPGVYDYLAHARSARSQLGALPRHNLRTSPADVTSDRHPGGKLLADAAVDSGK